MVTEKEIVIDLLCKAFDNNPSVNFVVKQDGKRKKRLKLLIEYCYYNCNTFGKIYINEEKTCCALTIEPLRKKTNFTTIWWDIKLALGCIGQANIRKVMKPEAAIKKLHPKKPFIHLWYVGVLPEHQGKGLGTAMINTMLEDAKAQNKDVYFETSNPKNFPLYNRLGFDNFAGLAELGYDLRMYRMVWGAN